MMMRKGTPHIEIVFVDGKEVPGDIARATVEMDPGEPMKVVLELLVSEVKTEGNVLTVKSLTLAR
jgi:hypothetical protein